MMIGQNMQKFLGGPPAAVLVKLVFLSIIVGVFLALFDLTPWDLFHTLRRLFDHVLNMGFEAVRDVARYFVYGAVIVIPIWIVLRLLRAVR
jgi:hypothetical protein